MSHTLSLVAAAASLCLCASATATVHEIFPSNADADCDEQFESLANALQPGDELILNDGDYSQSCRRAITVNGTPDAPVLIRAADGATATLTRPAGDIDRHNNIEIVDSSHLVIRGLRFRGGSAGVRFIRGHHITFEDNEILETGNNAIAMNTGDTDAFVIRGNHIHHTGLSSGSTEGEGMYVGCHGGGCTATNHLIEDNYIHHLRGTSVGGNDGIEIKAGSYANVVRGNVIHDTTIGRRYPCIFVYGGGPQRNLVENNHVWNCGEAILAVADAVVRNNVVRDSDIGVSAIPHETVDGQRNLSIVNNTVYGNDTCLYALWNDAEDVRLANNAFFCPGRQAVDATGMNGDAVTASANVVSGATAGISVDGTRFVAGGDPAQAFVDAGAANLRPAPGSPLVDSGDTQAADLPQTDFDGNPRIHGEDIDVGAYELNDDADTDGDSVPDGADNCRQSANQDQRDTDGDGIGNACDADIAPGGSDCLVNFSDLVAIKQAFFSTPLHGAWNADADFDGDGVVAFSDLGLVKADFFRDYRLDNPAGTTNLCLDGASPIG